MLEQIARIRACLLKGNELDIKKAANLFLDDFRSGKLGRISLEFPPSVPSEDSGAQQKQTRRHSMRTLKGEKLEQELLRLEAMKEYEKKYGAGAVVCGIDEAGRGLWPVRW